MLKLDMTDAYRWPVSISRPVDGGKYDAQEFTGVFCRFTQGQLDDMAARAAKGELSDDLMVEEVLVGWEDVQEDGKPILFGGLALRALLDIPGAAASIIAAFVESVKGAKRKN